jgi:hypothetical protein
VNTEQGFFLQICDVVKLAIIHKQGLANFGYRTADVKIDIFLFWLLAGTY